MLLLTEVECHRRISYYRCRASYLADNVILLRYLEIHGEIRKAIGVLKKRTSDFGKTMRELTITRYGIKVGKPMTELRGILRGVPEWVKPQLQ